MVVTSHLDKCTEQMRRHLKKFEVVWFTITKYYEIIAKS